MICMFLLRNRESSAITGIHVYIMETSVSHLICEFEQLFEIYSKLKKRSG